MLWSLNTLLAPKNFVLDHLIKLEWLTTHVTAVGLLTKAECENFQVILDVCRPIQAAFVIGEPVCDLELLSWALKPYFGLII